jgi:hypothetical protein
MDNRTRVYALPARPMTAELVYDTRQQTLPRGVRTLIERERRLLFAAERYEVVLEVAYDASDGWSCVTGQVLADGAPVPGVAVTLDDGTVLRTDDNGSFRLVQVISARCGLRFDGDTWALVVPPVALVPTTEARP